MGSRVVKIATLVAASLLVAAVCFGVLESSGTLSNAGYKFGGAFAGFLITLLVLIRAWGPEDLAQIASRANADMAFDEIVKVLDLRNAPPSSDRQKAVLCDYRRGFKTKDDRAFHLHYATTGEQIDFVGSATHPTTTSWHEGAVEHVGPGGEVLKHQYDLVIPLADVASGEVVPIAIEICYVNAFKNPTQEWLETHVDQPTRRLVMIILIPESMRSISAGIVTKKEGRGKLAQFPDPRVVLDGSFVYWSIDYPSTEVRYALNWRWVQRAESDPP